MKTLLTILTLALFVSSCGKPAADKSATSAPSVQTAAPSAAGIVKEVAEADFKTEISQGITIVDFWAPWCKPCLIQAPIMDQIAQSSAAKVIKVNIDKAESTVNGLGIETIPTVIIFKDGVEAERFVGLTEANEITAAIPATNRQQNPGT